MLGFSQTSPKKNSNSFFHNSWDQHSVFDWTLLVEQIQNLGFFFLNMKFYFQNRVYNSRIFLQNPKGKSCSFEISRAKEKNFWNVWELFFEWFSRYSILVTLKAELLSLLTLSISIFRKRIKHFNLSQKF